MKAALLVLVLLVHTVHSYSDIRAKTIQFFNSARSLIAKNAQIANMNELEYHQELENILYVQLGDIGGCSVLRIIYDDSDSKILVEYHLNVDIETMDKQSFSKLFGGAANQVMAHVETKCMETGKDVHSYVFYKTSSMDHLEANARLEEKPLLMDCVLLRIHILNGINRPIGEKNSYPEIFGTMNN